LVGVPGSQDAAPSSGSVYGAHLVEIVDYSKQFSSMGGVMVWDASHLQTNPGL
jgi:chitinase